MNNLLPYELIHSQNLIKRNFILVFEVIQCKLFNLLCYTAHKILGHNKATMQAIETKMNIYEQVH